MFEFLKHVEVMVTNKHICTEKKAVFTVQQNAEIGRMTFITSNELLCSIVIILSNYLYYLGVTE
jgi:hypothetical protein